MTSLAAPKYHPLHENEAASDELKVVTWNLLEDIFADPKLYLGFGEALEPQQRTSVHHQRLVELAPDIVLLQELGRGALDAALAGPLAGFGHVFQSVVPKARTFTRMNGEKRTNEWGVAIAWRAGVLRNAQQLELDVPGCYGGAHQVAVVHADVAAWGGPAIFVCVHLDGEGCPPSVTRSQEQACAICAQVQEHARRLGVARIVWGGDFNQPADTPALRACAAGGLRMISGEPRLPTCFTVVSYSRIDHFLAAGVKCTRTEIPTCPRDPCGACMPAGALIECGLKTRLTRSTRQSAAFALSRRHAVLPQLATIVRHPRHHAAQLPARLRQAPARVAVLASHRRRLAAPRVPWRHPPELLRAPQAALEVGRHRMGLRPPPARLHRAARVR